MMSEPTIPTPDDFRTAVAAVSAHIDGDMPRVTEVLAGSQERAAEVFVALVTWADLLVRTLASQNDRDPGEMLREYLMLLAEGQ